MVAPGAQQYSLGDWANEIRTVPSEGTDGSCKVCLGVTSGPGYDTCFKCGRHWRNHPFFGRVRLVVPCTVAVAGTPWYTAMRSYKDGQFSHFAPVLAVVLNNWVVAQWGQLTHSLGGPPDLLMVVPSRRRSFPTPLLRVVEAAFVSSPDQRLTHVAEAVRPLRDQLDVGSFEVEGDLTGLSVLLIEDTWVGGQTAISSAIALAQAGASSVAVVSIARMVYPDSMSSDYEAGAGVPINFDHWPR